MKITDNFGSSVNNRIDAFKSFQDHLPNYISRNRPLNPADNICIVKTSYNDDFTEAYKDWLYTFNIVTDQGDLYYAQQAASETVTEDFGGANGRQELRTGAATPAKADQYAQVTTPVTASRKIIDATYQKTNDADADNTGSGTDIVTWLTSWTTGDFNQTAIIGGTIHDGGASPSGTTELLTHWSISSFDKTSADTLKIFVNHTFNGV